MDSNQNCIEGNTCLGYACMCNDNLEVIKYLIENIKMNQNHRNNEGKTYLHIACIEKNNLEAIRYLIEEQHMDQNKDIMKIIHV